MPTILMTRDGPLAVIAPADYLGDRFAAYREAVAGGGGRWEPARKANTAPVAAAAGIADRLRAAGFHVGVHEDLVAAALEARLVQTRAIDAATERLAHPMAAQLYPYQRDGVRWLAPRDRALLADEMGLGKTVQALLALPAGARAVVVAPAAVKGSWRAEVQRWRPDLSTRVLQGRGAWRWPDVGEVIITNYDILPALAGVGAVPRGVVVVADEAHALKSSKAQRTKKFRELTKAIRKAGGATWLLTGTPLLNRPPELWGVLAAADLEKEAFGAWPRFTALFHAYHGKFGMVWPDPRERPPKPEVAECLRRVSLRRERATVLPDLPTWTYQDRPCNGDVKLSASDQGVCDAALDALDVAGDDPDETLKPGMPGFAEISHAREVLARAKIPAAVALAEEFEEADEPIVVFAAHRAPVAALAARTGWASITGDTPAEERTRIVALFQAGKLKGLAATIRAAGVGLTLTRAAFVAFVDRDWTPALNAQARDRLVRIGQRRAVVVIRLIADHPLDARIAELLDEKDAYERTTVRASARDVGLVVAPVAVPVGDVAPAAPATATSSDTSYDTPPPAAPRRAPRRGPNGAIEEWVVGALSTLAGLDPDGAAVRNDVGFNTLDGALGHALAAQLERGLTDRQWQAATRIARRYPRQVGRPPAAQGGST